MPIAYRNHATSTGSTSRATTLAINKPTGTLEGDFMIAIMYISSDTASLTPPSGWSKLTTVAGQNIFVYSKFAGSSEGSSYSWGIPAGTQGGEYAFGGIISYSGVDPTTPINVSASSVNAAVSTNWVSPSVSTTVPNTRVVRVVTAAMASSGANVTVAPPTGHTEIFEIQQQQQTSSTHRKLEVADADRAATGSTGSGTHTSSFSSSYDAITIALAPELTVTAVQGACAVAGTALVAPTGRLVRRAAAAVAGVGAVAVNARTVRRGAVTISGAGSVAASGTSTVTETQRSFWAAFTPPSAPLIPGPGRQILAMRIRKQAGASVTPTVRLDITDGETNTVVASVIPDTSVTSTGWVPLEGAFDAAILPNPADDLYVRVVNVTPGLDPALDVGAIEWFTTTELPGYLPVTGIASIVGDATVTPAGRLLKRGAVGVGGAATVEPAPLVALRGSADIQAGARTFVYVGEPRYNYLILFVLARRIEEELLSARIAAYTAPRRRVPRPPPDKPMVVKIGDPHPPPPVDPDPLVEALEAPTPEGSAFMVKVPA